MRARAALTLIAAAATALMCAGICAAAIVAHAPTAVVPLVVVISIGCPIFAVWEVPNAIVSLRAEAESGGPPGDASPQPRAAPRDRASARFLTCPSRDPHQGSSRPRSRGTVA